MLEAAYAETAPSTMDPKSWSQGNRVESKVKALVRFW